MSPIQHKWQKTDYTCGATACGMILGISEEEADKLCAAAGVDY